MADTRAILGAWRAARGAGTAAGLAFISTRAAAAHFRDLVEPMIAASFDGPDRQVVSRSLRPASAKFTYLMTCYARMTGIDDAPEIAVLAGACSRLYDDLFDESDPRAAGGMANLFAPAQGAPMTPHLELLQRILLAVADRMPSSAHVPALVGLSHLHSSQVESLRQGAPGTPDQEIRRICRAKGRAAAETFFRSVHPGMSNAQFQLALRLGEMFQSLDDLADAGVDRADGLSTPVTRGTETVASVARDVRSTSAELAGVYGSRAKAFNGLLFLQLVVAAVSFRRHHRGRAPVRSYRGPLRELVLRNDGTVRPVVSLQPTGGGRWPAGRLAAEPVVEDV